MVRLTPFLPNMPYVMYWADGIGRNKLIINHLGRMFVTSDAATIIREIEVAHPAAKLLVMASTAQETEVGLAITLTFCVLLQEG